MKTKIIFAGLLGLAVMLPLSACSEPQDDYEKGRVAFIAKDYPEALRWLRKAAEQNHARAQHNLGDMYYGGKGIKQEYPRSCALVSQSR